MLSSDPTQKVRQGLDSGTEFLAQLLHSLRRREQLNRIRGTGNDQSNPSGVVRHFHYGDSRRSRNLGNYNIHRPS